jgi:hypothetical protein
LFGWFEVPPRIHVRLEIELSEFESGHREKPMDVFREFSLQV